MTLLKIVIQRFLLRSGRLFFDKELRDHLKPDCIGSYPYVIALYLTQAQSFAVSFHELILGDSWRSFPTIKSDLAVRFY